MLVLSAIPSLARARRPAARLPDTPRWYLMKGRRDEARETLALTDPDADTERELDEIEEDLRRERGGSIARDAARPVPPRDAVRRRPRLPHPDHRHQRGRLLQPADLQGDGLQRERGAAAAARARPGRLARRDGRLAVGRRPPRAPPDAADRHRRDDRLDAAARGRVRRRATSPARAGWLGFVGIFVFTAGFNFGFGSLVWVYASESFPARLRTTGASAMLTADLVANLIIGAVLPQRARVARRDGDVRDVRGAGGDLVRVRLVARARRRRAGRSRRSARTGRTAGAGRRRPRARRRRRTPTRASPARANARERHGD